MSKGEAKNIITNAHKVSNVSYPTTLSSTNLMYMDECEVLELHGKDFDLSCLDGSVRYYPDNIDYVLSIASNSQDYAFARCRVRGRLLIPEPVKVSMRGNDDFNFDQPKVIWFLLYNIDEGQTWKTKPGEWTIEVIGIE
jgi:hypothetical protein